MQQCPLSDKQYPLSDQFTNLQVDIYGKLLRCTLYEKCNRPDIACMQQLRIRFWLFLCCWCVGWWMHSESWHRFLLAIAYGFRKHIYVRMCMTKGLLEMLVKWLTKYKGQAVDFNSQVFLRDRVNASCGVSKQDNIPFARSENDDVMKPQQLRNVCGFAIQVLSSFAALKCSHSKRCEGCGCYCIDKNLFECLVFNDIISWFSFIVALEILCVWHWRSR